MELQTLKIRFYPKQKSGKNDAYMLYMRLVMGGKRAEICINYQLTRDAWNFNEQTLKNRHPDKGYVINLTNQYRQNALQIYRQFLQRGLPCDVMTIRGRLVGKEYADTSLVPTLMKLCEKVIDRKKSLPGPNNSKASIQKYERIKSHLIIYLAEYYQAKDIACGKIDLEFIENLEVYLKTTGKCAHNTTMKHIQTFKTIYKVAIAHGWTDKDPFQKYKISLREVVRDYLTEKELHQLINTDLPPNKLANVRDLFLFSCFTGLAYIDLYNLSVKNIYKENGKYWIRTRRQKTNVKSNIPLLDIPLKLVLKSKPDFENAEPNDKIFRVISNQKANVYLKELAEICSIKKCLTFHIARHTFATTITLNNGVPIESVAAMLGHKHITTTQHYAKLLDKKLEADMEKLGAQLRF